MNVIGAAIKGMYRDVLVGPDGVRQYDSGWVSNTIVNDCRVLLACLLKNDVTGGIRYLAVGPGLEAWDEATPAPTATTSDLEKPYHEILIERTGDTRLELIYLNQADEEVRGPTPRLQITATLAPGFPSPVSDTEHTYPLREFGLFGGSPGQGDKYLINCVRHPVIHKPEAATLVRVIRLYF
jgi:hypothetical protein